MTMIVKPDGLPRRGHALQNMATREIVLVDIAATQEACEAALTRMREAQPRRGPHRIVPVRITVELEDG